MVHRERRREGGEVLDCLFCSEEILILRFSGDGVLVFGDKGEVAERGSSATAEEEE